MSHLFSLGHPWSICFPWASLAFFLTLHFHRFLLSSLGFPGPITSFLILRAYGLAINPWLSLLSLLWAYRGPFSLFHIIYCPWFAFFSLSRLLSAHLPPQTHLFISWACYPLFLPLGLNGFSIYFTNSLLSALLGFSFLLRLPKLPSTFSPLNIWSVHAVHMWMKDFLALSIFPFYFPLRFFLNSGPYFAYTHTHTHTHTYIYIYIYIFVVNIVVPLNFPT